MGIQLIIASRRLAPSFNSSGKFLQFGTYADWVYSGKVLGVDILTNCKNGSYFTSNDFIYINLSLQYHFDFLTNGTLARECKYYGYCVYFPLRACPPSYPPSKKPIKSTAGQNIFTQLRKQATQ